MKSFISVQIDIDKATRGIEKVAEQSAFATSQSINDVAFSSRKDAQAKVTSGISGPTPATRSAVRVINQATKQKLFADVGLADAGTKSGAAAMDAERTIGHHFIGGARRFKRFEAAFARLGYLAPGEYIVPADQSSWAVRYNRYGNLPPGFIVQLISYFSGFGEQGYKANMTDKRKRALMRAGRTESGYRTINGVQYFAIPSRSQWGRFPRLINGRHDPHLAPGIWAKRGTHGSDVAPVVLFVKRATYRKRFDFPRMIGDVVKRDFATAFSRRLQAALRSAR